jgi:hypothetical protein
MGNAGGSFPVPYTWIALAISIATGAIWLGSNTNQIGVNSARLTRLEEMMDEVRQHDSNTTARLPAVEHRLDQLETWQMAVKRGDQK